MNESELGLCFLAVGVGASLGSFLNGVMLDTDFKRIQRILEKKAIASKRGQQATAHVDGKLVAEYPIEYARLRLVPVHLAIYVTSMIGYGWALQLRVNIACPLILQFLSKSVCFCCGLVLWLIWSIFLDGIVGWSTINVMNTTQTLLMDLFYTQGSSITAAVSARQTYY